MKYRQPGYHDDDYKKERERKEQRGPRGPRDIATREATAVVRCFNCGLQTPPAQGIGPDSVCEKCGSDLHVCRNCAHFDPGARWECRKPIPAPIRSKIARNDCEVFAPQVVLDATGRRASGPAAPTGARAAFEALFKKK
ncbi:MAG TPA: hypothetical protein VKL61_00130 [Candidatus Polarisedimenticolia bacterium]|nr:hypothetical protein [Candidatus Polarisedimenticolia bacterium]